MSTLVASWFLWHWSSASMVQGHEEERISMSDTPSAGSLRKHQALPQAYFVYMVRCANGAFYSGYTTNVDKRIATHNAGKGAKYTRAHLPVILLAAWSFPSKGEALRAEHAIKQLSRAQKKLVIEQTLQGFLPLPDWVSHSGDIASQCRQQSSLGPAREEGRG